MSSARAEALAALGLPAGASKDDIKSAYRRLARENHPDHNPDDPEAAKRFRVAAQAYRTLTEETKSPSADSPPRPEASPGEIFEKVFGRGRGRRRSVRGADLKYTLRIDFMEAVAGGSRTIHVPGNVTCRRCGGTGAEPGSTPLLCPRCRGEGVLPRRKGFFEAKETCPQCQGRGRIFPDPCRSCDGRGHNDVEREIPLQLPLGVKDGTRLRVSGEGQPGEGGAPPGDLYVVIEVEPHPLFAREGDDVVVEVPVSFPLAALGGHVRIPTLQGAVRMRVPPGSVSGRVFRLKGKGFDGGDQRVVLRLEMPDQLSEEAEQALRRYGELEDTQDGLPLAHAFRAAVARQDQKGRG